MNHQQWKKLTIQQKIRHIKVSGGSVLPPDDLGYAASNMEFLDKFIEESFKISRVRQHYSAQTIIEIIRHHSAITDDSPNYKISHRARAIFSRLVMALFPELNGLFKTKRRI